ncbi:MAG: hypothetical protein ACE145_18585 [Terriglobia bacterium]
MRTQGLIAKEVGPSFWKAITYVLISTLIALPALAAQDEQEPPQPPEEGPAPTAPQPEAPAAYNPLPQALTLAAGTMISIRTSQYLSSDQNRPGDSFSAELQQPLVVDGWVVARRGQTVVGRVVTAQKAGRIKGVSQLGIELSQLVLVDGQQMPIRTQLMQTSGGKTQGRDAQAAGTTTGVGALIGAAADGGRGAAIGAGAGAAAGLVGVLLTRGRPTEIPPETLLTFQLEFPVTFSTQRSGPAFRPVNQADYDSGRDLRRRTDHFAVPHRRPPTLYPYGYYPPPVYFGFSYFRFGGRHHHRW